MSEVTQIDKEQKAVELFGKVHMNVWQAHAGADLARDLAIKAGRHPDSQDCMEKVHLACNGLLAATSFLMEDVDELQVLLDVSNPEWAELEGNLSSGGEIREKLKGGMEG